MSFLSKKVTIKLLIQKLEQYVSNFSLLETILLVSCVGASNHILI